MRVRNIFAALVFVALAEAQDPKYAGSEACQTCHEDLGKAFTKTPHQRLETNAKSGWQGKACESCHGPGAKHVESAAAADIVNPPKLASARADKLCATCHREQLKGAAGVRGHSGHQVGCTSCHKLHGETPESLVARAPAAVNHECASCHASDWAQFQKPFHHRLPENAMSCTDCHNPHGTAQAGMQRTFAGNERGCFQCHGDKRGPFTFEHAPMRFEGCGACHESHGSANPHMLTRQEVRLTCLECHSSLPAQVNTNAKLGVVPPSFHDIRLPRYRNCTICHQKVHGSYVDRNLLR